MAKLKMIYIFFVFECTRLCFVLVIYREDEEEDEEGKKQKLSNK